MSQKLWKAGLIALILVVAVAGSALAASGDADPGNPPGPNGGRHGGQRSHAVGEVTAIGDEEFTLLTRADVELTVLVDEDTRYLGQLGDFDDLEVGMMVGVAGIRQGEQTLLAKVVGSGPGLRQGKHAHGEVTDVDDDSLTIETRSGDSLTFEVTGETRFFSRNGEVQELSDIEEGDQVMVLYVEENGELIAKAIGVGGPKADGPRPNGPPS